MRTFIVRLQEDMAGGDRSGVIAPRLRGVVDEVATGLRATFRNDSELLTALTAAMTAADPPGPKPSRGDRAPARPSSD